MLIVNSDYLSISTDRYDAFRYTLTLSGWPEKAVQNSTSYLFLVSMSCSLIDVKF